MEQEISLIEKSWKERMIPILIFLTFIVLVAIYEFFVRNEILEKGVYSKCVILNAEGYKGGVLISFSYKFKNKIYTGRRSSGRIGKGNINDQFFIKVLPEEPTSTYILDLVPDCLLHVEAPTDGWKEIPKSG